MSTSLDFAADVSPVFALEGVWKPLTGFGFGFREPAILVRIRVAVPDRFDQAELDARMAVLVDAPPPEHGRDDSPSTRLVRRALFWTGALQRQERIPVFGVGCVVSSRPDQQLESFTVALPYFVPNASLAAAQWIASAIQAFFLTGDLLGEHAGEAPQGIATVRKAMQQARPAGINSYRFLSAAFALDIPVNHFMPGVMILGVGRHARWLRSSYTDRTSLLASHFAADKFLTAQVLRRAGLPAPTHALSKTPEEAVQIARGLGYPVVVKPADKQQGRGVAANLRTDEEVARAFHQAAAISKNILVEKHFDGREFRMTVLDGRLLRTFEKIPGGVVGDGESTIAQLVELSQRDDRQVRRIRERGRTLLALDNEALELVAAAGQRPDSVLDKGAYQQLRRRGNVSAGGSTRVLDLDTIHPDNRSLAERAAAALRLDVAGVDLIIPDIARSWLESGALICEVNAEPQIGVGSTETILKGLISGQGRIPVLTIVGNIQASGWKDLLAGNGRSGVGVATREATWLGGTQLAGVMDSGFAAAQALLGNADVEAAIIVMPPAEIRRFGLPHDKSDLLAFASPDDWDGDRKVVEEILRMALPNAIEARVLGAAASVPDALPRLDLDVRGLCERFLGEALPARAAL